MPHQLCPKAQCRFALHLPQGTSALLGSTTRSKGRVKAAQPSSGRSQQGWDVGWPELKVLGCCAPGLSEVMLRGFLRPWFVCPLSSSCEHVPQTHCTPASVNFNPRNLIISSGSNKKPLNKLNGAFWATPDRTKGEKCALHPPNGKEIPPAASLGLEALQKGLVLEHSSSGHLD